ncbi:MAG: hypothetical protein JRI97_04885 [Deltaproteobacteria bacterium]|nr:hypothetical protein [Deltaproteobacteria bacterium]
MEAFIDLFNQHRMWILTLLCFGVFVLVVRELSEMMEEAREMWGRKPQGRRPEEYPPPRGAGNRMPAWPAAASESRAEEALWRG